MNVSSQQTQRRAAQRSRRISSFPTTTWRDDAARVARSLSEHIDAFPCNTSSSDGSPSRRQNSRERVAVTQAHNRYPSTCGQSVTHYRYCDCPRPNDRPSPGDSWDLYDERNKRVLAAVERGTPRAALCLARFGPRKTRRPTATESATSLPENPWNRPGAGARESCRKRRFDNDGPLNGGPIGQRGPRPRRADTSNARAHN
jgi:hypothetical protein